MFIYTEKQTLFPNSNYRQVLFNLRCFYLHIFQQRACNSKASTSVQDSQRMALPGTVPCAKRCALSFDSDIQAATGQPRSSYKETIILYLSIFHTRLRVFCNGKKIYLKIHKGCTIFSRNYNCNGSPAE